MVDRREIAVMRSISYGFHIKGLISIVFPITSNVYAVPIQLNVALQWDNATLQGIRDSKLGAPMVARALAIVHTCMYDAWSAYDERAVTTRLQDALRRPLSERTDANKEKAISYAAFRALRPVRPSY